MPRPPFPRHSVTQPLDQSYRLIPLTRGQTAIVDTDDFERLMEWDWYAHYRKRTHAFYGVRSLTGGQKIFMANEVLQCERGVLIDHRNHNGLDNRKSNLRRASYTQNSCNSRMQRNNKTGYIGVYMHKEGKWCAQIAYDGRRTHLGTFPSPEDAARARDKAAKELHGEFAVLNL